MASSPESISKYLGHQWGSIQTQPAKVYHCRTLPPSASMFSTSRLWTVQRPQNFVNLHKHDDTMSAKVMGYSRRTPDNWGGCLPGIRTNLGGQEALLPPKIRTQRPNFGQIASPNVRTGTTLAGRRLPRVRTGRSGAAFSGFEYWV